MSTLALVQARHGTTKKEEEEIEHCGRMATRHALFHPPMRATANETSPVKVTEVNQQMQKGRDGSKQRRRSTYAMPVCVTFVR